MNVIVANKNKGLLNSLDIDVIKSIEGEYTAEELINTFSKFFFNRMFLDITAIKDYFDISNIQKLSMGLEMDKVIFLLDNTLYNNKSYLSQLISMGIYNFANTKESLMYLYNHPNTYKDVAHIHNIGSQQSKEETNKKQSFFGKKEEEPGFQISKTAKVIGFQNVTKSAGATTLIYVLKKMLSEKDYVVAIEVNKNDFGFFNEKDMYSVNKENLPAAINRFGNANMILVDLNETPGEVCDDIIYLIEPSIIKLNKLMLVHKDVFDKLYGKKIILNKSLLSAKDVSDFEFESHSKISYNMPPINDRIDNTDKLQDFLNKLEL